MPFTTTLPANALPVLRQAAATGGQLLQKGEPDADLIRTVNALLKAGLVEGTSDHRGQLGVRATAAGIAELARLDALA